MKVFTNVCSDGEYHIGTYSSPSIWLSVILLRMASGYSQDFVFYELTPNANGFTVPRDYIFYNANMAFTVYGLDAAGNHISQDIALGNTCQSQCPSLSGYSWRTIWKEIRSVKMHSEQLLALFIVVCYIVRYGAEGRAGSLRSTLRSAPTTPRKTAGVKPLKYCCNRAPRLPGLETVSSLRRRCLVFGSQESWREVDEGKLPKIKNPHDD